MARAKLPALIVIAVLASGLVWAEESASNEPTWAHLSDQQRTVLQPLSTEWDTLRPWQREKMLDIARDYPKMNAQRQALIQKRLSDWSRMTPFERENARKKYQQYKTLSAEKKQELRNKWLEYQKLPEDKRQALRKEQPEIYGREDLEN